MIDSFAILGGWTTLPLSRDGAGSARRAAVVKTVRGAARTLWQTVSTAHRLRRARRQLLALDDRLLRDAGISRYEVDALVEDLWRQSLARRA